MTPEHVCAFYSDGASYVTVLKEMRALKPDARICAVVPVGLDLADVVRPLADEVVEVERDCYSPRNPQACLRLVRTLRARRFDLFVVLFCSPQLRLLASVSGARRAECWDQYYRISPLSTSALGWSLGLVARILRGRMRWLKVWMQVHVRRITPAPRSR